MVKGLLGQPNILYSSLGRTAKQLGDVHDVLSPTNPRNETPRNPDCQRPQPYDKAIPQGWLSAELDTIRIKMDQVETMSCSVLAFTFRTSLCSASVRCQVLIDYTGWTPGGKMSLGSLRAQPVGCGSGKAKD